MKLAPHIFFYLLLILFFQTFFGCETKGDSLNVSDSYIAPIVVDFKPNGYNVNVVFNSEIDKEGYSTGDSIKTGIPLAIKGKVVCSADTTIPKLLNKYDSIPKKISTKNQTFHIPGNEFPLAENAFTKLKYEPVSYVVDTFSERDFSQNSTPLKSFAPELNKSSSINVSFIGTDQGLLSSYVNVIIEDSRNNKWIGYDGGDRFTKYDGVFLTHYNLSNIIGANYSINCFFEDSRGNIWIGSDKFGLFCYDGVQFINFWTNDIIGGNHILSLEEDGEHNIFIATNGGLIKYDGQKFEFTSKKNGLAANKINDLHKDAEGSVWLVMSRGKVSKIRNDSVVHMKLAYEKDVISIFEDSQGKIWFGLAESILAEYDGERMTYFKLNDKLFEINSINEDAKGNIWISLFGAGLYMYNGEIFVNFNKTNGLNSDFLYEIHRGSDCSFWVSAFAGGINKINLSAFAQFDINPDKDNDIVWRIFEDSQNNVWFGTVGDAVYRFDGKNTYKYNTEQGLSAPTIMCFLEDKDHNIWMGSPGAGVYRFDGDRFYNFSKSKNGFPIDYIASMLQDSEGNIWFGTQDQGLLKYDGQYFTLFTVNDGFASNTIWDIFEDSKGNVWFGTEGGLIKFNGETFTNYTEMDGLSSSVIFSIIEDSLQNIWCGTENGLTKFDGEKWTHFTKEHGLAGNIVLSIIETKKNHFWLSTESGVNHFIVNDTSLKIESYKKMDGLAGIDFFIDGIFKDSKNKLWFNSNKSVETLDLSYQNESLAAPPSVQLRWIEVNGVRPSFDTLNQYHYDGIEKFTNLPVNLKLSHHQNNIVFNYSASYWVGQHRIKYSCFLEGYSESWTKPSQEVKVNFTNLSPGMYHFKVKAIDNYGAEGPVMVYAFAISPPWWLTIWSKTSAIILLCFLVYLIVRLRTRKLQISEMNLKGKVLQATHDLRGQKKEIETQHREIMDSINYAKRIQSAILSPPSIVKEYLEESLIVYVPKDVVAGDFYWMHQNDGKILFAAADCTGHGVPGAMISVVCSNALNRSAREYGLTKPSDILNKTWQIVSEEFEKSDENVNDGMDIALCALSNKKLEYAGAYMPLWIVREDKIIEIKGDKQPIGKFENFSNYTAHELDLQSGDTLFIFSDGLVDQFGGEKGKKMKPNGLRSLLLSIRHLSMLEQRTEIYNAFQEWKGDLEQVDDVCIIGVKIS